MLDAAGVALSEIFGCPCIAGVIPAHLAFLAVGVVLGLAVGVMPGLGGVTVLALLIPFTYDLDTGPAIALLIGLLAVTTTSDTIPAVLFAVPGESGAQATILDGHAMARKGEAGRALGAAYSASLIGGLFGALILALSVPVLRPLVLAFGSPEFFMLGILGISMVAALSVGTPVKGLIAGFGGLLLGAIGRDPVGGFARWDFGQSYLWDGLPLVPLTLGLFALPEMVDLVVRGTAIAGNTSSRLSGVVQGVRDTVRHWFLVLRCSAVGVWFGAIPGLGNAVVNWLAYGHALQTVKGASASFGKGDVRGVIAPESAVNAKDGGALIPTLAFGVPGSSSMVLLLAAFYAQGINPGPDMLDQDVEITYTLIWSLALANVLGTALVLLITRPLARLSTININLLVPGVIVVVFFAAFQETRNLGDVGVLLAMGLLGWFMKWFGWPRPPLLLAFVLSNFVERNFFVSVQAYGAGWIFRPLVLLILVITIASLVYASIRNRRGGGHALRSTISEEEERR